MTTLTAARDTDLAATAGAAAGEAEAAFTAAQTMRDAATVNLAMATTELTAAESALAEATW